MSVNPMSVNPMSVKMISSPALRPNPLPRVLLRLALPAAAITLALAAEVSIVPRLRLPHATPDLLLLVVLGFAAVWGAAGGALTGFAAGLVLDLAPPSVDAIGRHALVLTCVGALAGRAGRQVHSSALRTCLLAGLYAALAVAGNALLGTVLGDGSGLNRPGLAAAAGAAALYTAVATPLIVPGIAALARRTQSPGARVIAPAGDAMGQLSPAGIYGAFDGMTFRGAVAPAAARSHVVGVATAHAHPEHAHADHGHPDHGHPDHSHSDPTHPGHSHPDHARPDHAHPDHTHPDHAHPDHVHSDLAHPDPVHSDLAHPGAALDSSTPNTAALDSSTPSTSVLNPSAPDPTARGTHRAIQNPEAG